MKLKHKPVKLDMAGYAAPGGDSITARGYLWIGDDHRCYTHTTSLRSLRGLRDLCDKLIKARESAKMRAKMRAKLRRASRTTGEKA